MLLKMGSHGARIITQTIDVSVTVVTKLNPEVSKEYQIVNTVGAGDCFTSAFVIRFSEFGKKQLNEE